MKKITAVKFKDAGNKGVVIDWTISDESGVIAEDSRKTKHPPHKTFIDALQDLKKHLMLIVEWNGVTANKFKKIENFEVSEVEDRELRICGVSITGDDEKEGVIITAYRTMSNGLGYVFNSPLTKFENEGETKYKFSNDLEFALDDLKKEAEEYLAGKYGVVQGNLFEGGEPAPAGE